MTATIPHWPSSSFPPARRNGRPGANVRWVPHLECSTLPRSAQL
jgi:hypothetical protein